MEINVIDLICIRIFQFLLDGGGKKANKITVYHDGSVDITSDAWDPNFGGEQMIQQSLVS